MVSYLASMWKSPEAMNLLGLGVTSRHLRMPPIGLGERFSDVYEIVLVLDNREQFSRRLTKHHNSKRAASEEALKVKAQPVAMFSCLSQVGRRCWLGSGLILKRSCDRVLAWEFSALANDVASKQLRLESDFYIPITWTITMISGGPKINVNTQAVMLFGTLAIVQSQCTSHCSDTLLGLLVHSGGHYSPRAS